MAKQRNLQLFCRRLRLKVWLCASILWISGGVITARAQTPTPVLVSQATSTRAISLESLNFVSEPFKLESPQSFGDDRRTRVMLFAVNLSLQPGETLSSVSADAEDGSQRHYNLPVEYVGPVPEQEWLTSVVLRLSDDLGDVGDVLVRVTHAGIASNRVRIAIGHIGGGPADDAGAAPTPAPPYLIMGQVTSAASGLSGVTVSLNGPQSDTVVTDANGSYQFTVRAAGGPYSLTAVKAFYDLSAGPTFTNLSNSQPNVNFTAQRQTHTISGKVMDDAGQGIGSIQVTIRDEADAIVGTSLTGNAGIYSFANLPAGFGYKVTAATTNFFTFTPRTTPLLSSNVTLDINGVRRSYAISGLITDASGIAMNGVTINLGGTRSTTVISDPSGLYSFPDLPAGGSYTLTPAANAFYTFTAQSVNDLGANQTVNFAGVLRKYSIGGRITNGTDGLAGISIQLTGSQSVNTITDGNGNFLFSAVPAAGNYTVTPVMSPFYSFTAQSVTNLGSNQTLNFTGTLRRYSLSGRITEGSNGVSGVTIEMTGTQQAMTTSDSSGNYTFADVIAGGNYTLVPSKTHCVFTPASQAVNNLGGDQNLNFNGSLRYQIRGRVADNSGRAVAGATVTMGGSELRNTATAADGSYSFTVSPGNYTLTPSIEQDWYSFTPSNQSLNSISDDQTVNFTATPAPLPNPPYVLEFDGSPKSVDYGYYWDPNVNLGHFFWEFWAMPGNNAGATYMLTDGYGGAHALLFGVANLGSSEPGRYQLFGNIFNAITHENYFRSDEGPAPGEWGHFAVGWDGENIITYLNGVPVGKSPFAGPRRTPGIGGGGSWLLIGGSTHNNFEGRIAQVRGYEVSNPREDPTGVDRTLVEAGFTPQTVFVGGGNLLSYYFRSAARVADLSQGYQGKSHVGLVRGTINWYFDPCTGCPLPQFVIDPTAPNFATGAPAPPFPVGSPPAAPAGARIFDSFSRANSTYVLNGKGGLGNTESGAAGVKAWQTSQDLSQPQPFGVLNGRAVMLANATYLTWIPTDSSSANLDIRVERRAGTVGSGLDTGLSFRVLDDRNFFFAYTGAASNASSPRSLTVGYYVGGQRVDLVTGVNMPASWTALRVITRSSGQITIYADGTQVYTTTNSLLPTASAAGLYNNSSGLGLVNRWDNFTVFDLP